jgi:hypothetical protein
LALEIETYERDNTLSAELKTDSWRPYTGRKTETWYALVPLKELGKQSVNLSTQDFKNVTGETLQDWFGITELIIQPGAKSKNASSTIKPWKGEVPQFHDLRWNGGKATRRAKPFLPKEPLQD